ncbi:MAG TPA: sodium:alanine symporter family protein [Gammaproteobacteria bacterium]|nr:sodium:alanine symporter family protein [Gammaproteobacteria bacterium]
MFELQLNLFYQQFLTPFLIVAILGTGLFLMIGLRFMPLIKLFQSVKMLWQGRREKAHQEGDISAFNALMTSLSATIGTGNIVGVATAIVLGGPGALFWMWMTALVGMATKYAEVLLAVHYREEDAKGNKVGGPMYYIKNGLGPKYKWLAVLFAAFGTLAGFGIGNTIQSNSVAQVFEAEFGIAVEVTGVIVALLVGLVLIGGIKRIAIIAGKLVPMMAIAYVMASILILIVHRDQIADTFELIFYHAFTPIAATGGFAGAAVWAAIHYGVARGIFSNEAGLGSAPIAHAAAKTNNPVRQGSIAVVGTFIDTLIICTLTGLVIIITGAWTSGENGAPLASFAFESALPGIGGYIIAVAQSIFALTTLLGWSVYGERCIAYLFGVKAIIPFRLLWILVIPIGAILDLGLIWLIADILNLLMAIPNLIALLLLSPVVFGLTRAYFQKRIGLVNED